MAELDEFLGGTEPEEEPVVAEATPELEPTPEPAEPEATPEPEPAPTEPPEPGDVTGLKSALQAERAKRNDYKGERDRLAGELAAFKVQFEAFQKAPPPAAVPAVQAQPVAVPNPVEDPQGYHAFIQQDIFNRSLNMSEAMLRQQIGDDADVDAKREKFRQMADSNPSLRTQLQQSAHPYRFVYDTAAKAIALEEIGDPTSFRSKLEAEIRAQVMAEVSGTTPIAAPRVQLPQSLGTARSAGSRNAPVINVPEAFDDILRVEKR